MFRLLQITWDSHQIKAFGSIRRLTQDLMFEKQPNADFSAVVTFDLPHSGLKNVDLSPVSVFDNLAR